MVVMQPKSRTDAGPLVALSFPRQHFQQWRMWCRNCGFAAPSVAPARVRPGIADVLSRSATPSYRSVGTCPGADRSPGTHRGLRRGDCSSTYCIVRVGTQPASPEMLAVDLHRGNPAQRPAGHHGSGPDVPLAVVETMEIGRAHVHRAYLKCTSWLFDPFEIDELLHVASKEKKKASRWES